MKEKVKKFYIADLHLFHDKEKLMQWRPFSSVEDMHDVIIENWKRKVKDKDIVYILGDVAYIGAPVEKVVKILKNLPGKKCLITGNHDRKLCHEKIFRNCFYQVTPYKETFDYGKKIVLCHYPIEEWDGKEEGYLHFHGHVHNKEEWVNGHKIEGRYNVSADVIGFMPRTFEEIVKG